MPSELSLSFKADTNLEVSNDLMHAFVFFLVSTRGSRKGSQERGKPFSLRGWNFTEKGLLLRISLLEDHPWSKQYVGNSLNCTSCHLDGGTNPK